VWGLEFVIGDAGFENWLVNRVLGWLSERGFRLPEFVVCELQLVSDGVRLRLLEVAETEDGDYGVVGVLYESNYSHQEMLYLYREYLLSTSLINQTNEANIRLECVQ
jgi:hypothetical protein